MKTHVIIAASLIVISSCLYASAQEAPSGELLGENTSVDNVLGDDISVDFKYRPNPNRIRLKATVTDALARQLKSGQSISVALPAGGPQAISSLVLRKPEFFKSKLLSIRPRTQITGGNLQIPIPIELVDRLEYQPIELKIFQSNVSQATLIPVYDTDENYGLARNNITADFFVRLGNDNGVAVALANFRRFNLKTDLFTVDIPVEQIGGIAFDPSDPESATVVLNNGDSISGEHDWPENVDFETPWGDESITLKQITSITRDKSSMVVPSGVENPNFILLRRNVNQNSQYLPQ